MPATLSVVAASPNEPAAVTILMSLIVGVVVAGIILWDRRYRRVWEQFRAEQWPPSEGHFSSGEVITMMTARSKQITEFEVRMYYQYEAGRTTGKGIYKRLLPTREAAEAYVERLAKQRIQVRIANGRPSVSCVLDKDVDTLVSLKPGN